MIHLDKICKKFDNTVAVDNLSLTINEGEIYGLLGANGAGKSTTINLLLGFISPDSGIITLEDKVNNKESKKANCNDDNLSEEKDEVCTAPCCSEK